jgi:hypothetical protein
MNRPSAFVLLVLAMPSAHAVDYELAGGKLSVKGSITAGAAFRTVPQDTDLLANVNSSQVGITGTALTPTTGRNQDDGNLNFNKHDAVSQVVNGYLSLEYKSGDYGGLVSTKLWYDYALEKVGHPWGNIPNGLAPDAPLNAEGAQPRSRFSKGGPGRPLLERPPPGGLGSLTTRHPARSTVHRPLHIRGTGWDGGVQPFGQLAFTGRKRVVAFQRLGRSGLTSAPAQKQFGEDE